MAFRIVRKLDWTAGQVSGGTGLTIVDEDNNPYIAKVDENETDDERSWGVEFAQDETDNTVSVEITQNKPIIGEYTIMYDAGEKEGYHGPNAITRYLVSGRTVCLADLDTGDIVGSGVTDGEGVCVIKVKGSNSEYRVIPEKSEPGVYFSNWIVTMLTYYNSIEPQEGVITVEPEEEVDDYADPIKIFGPHDVYYYSNTHEVPYYLCPEVTNGGSDYTMNNYLESIFVLGGKRFDNSSGKLCYVDAKNKLVERDENNSNVKYDVKSLNGGDPEASYDTQAKSTVPSDYTYSAEIKLPAIMGDSRHGWVGNLANNDYVKFPNHGGTKGKYNRLYGRGQVPLYIENGHMIYDGSVFFQDDSDIIGNGGTKIVKLNYTKPKTSIELDTGCDWINADTTGQFYKNYPLLTSNYGPERSKQIIIRNIYDSYAFFSGTTTYNVYKKANNNEDFAKNGIEIPLIITQESGSSTINVYSNASGATVTLYRGSISDDNFIVSGNVENGVAVFTGICESPETKVYAVIEEWYSDPVYTWIPNQINPNPIVFSAAGGEKNVSLKLQKSENKISSRIYGIITIKNDAEYEVRIDATPSTSYLSYQIGEQTKAVLTSYDVQVVDGDGNPVYFEDLSAYDSLNNYRVRARLVETNYGNGASYTNYGDWEIIDPSGYTEEYTEGDGEENYTVFDQESIKKFTLGEEYRNSDGTYPSVELKITRKAETVTANWDIATAISVPASSSTYTFGDDAYITVFADTLDSNGEVDSGNTYIAWSGKIFNSGQKISAGTTSYVEVGDARLILPEHGASLSTIAITDVDGNIITPSETINSGGTGAAVYHERNAQHTLTNGTSLSQATGMAFTPGENELVSLTETSGVTVNEILLTLKFD